MKEWKEAEALATAEQMADIANQLIAVRIKALEAEKEGNRELYMQLAEKTARLLNAENEYTLQILVTLLVEGVIRSGQESAQNDGHTDSQTT